jgi:outer membrane putative beta-barrel porin/alpha-amylase
MTKRTLLFMLLCCATGAEVLGQQQPNPWNCNNPKNNHLICLVPVATRSIGAVNSPAPTFNSSFASQLSQLPLLSSGSGIVLTLDKTLGVYVASENLGPILTDRAQTIGRHKLLLAFAFQYFHFNSIDGTDLNAAPFVFTAPSGVGGTQYTVEEEKIDMKLDQYVGLATFGLTANTDVSVIIPFGRVSIGTDSAVTLYSVAADGSPQSCVVFNSSTGTCTPFNTPHLGGSASGIGDMLVNVKRLFWSGEKSRLSAGLLVRFPTGDALNYLGSGAYGFNPYLIFSYQARLSPHFRLGYQFNTSTVLLPTFNQAGGFTGNASLPGGLQYDFGADYVLFKKVPTTVAGDFLGNYVVNSPVLKLLPFGSQPLGPPLVKAFGVNPPALIPGMHNNYSYNLGQISIGAKVKPWRALVLYGNVLFQVNNVGLRSNPVPLAGVSYTF